MKRKSLAETHPKLLDEWDYSKNTVLPTEVTYGSSVEVWWKCLEKKHKWQSPISHRTRKNRINRCKFCSNKEIGQGNDLATTHPQIVELWDFDKNTILPTEVTYGSGKSVWWKCREKKHPFESQVKHVVSFPNICKYCSNKEVGYGNDLATTHPELVKEWHPENLIKPTEVTRGSRESILWLCEQGCEWKETPKTRTGMKTNCPYCSGARVGYGNDLATTHPELVKEWHPENLFKPTEVTAGSKKIILWRCELGHEWTTRPLTRKYGSGCPECILPNKSKEEIYLLFELKHFFEIDPLNSKVKSSKLYDVDVKIPKLKLIVEYDGSYWHKDRISSDIEKTEALKSDNWIVIRARERPLKLLSKKYDVSVNSQSYKETANKVIQKIYEIGFNIENINQYLQRKTLINKKEADLFIKSMLKNK